MNQLQTCHDKFPLSPLASSAVQFSELFVAVQSWLQYLGLQQYSNTHGCSEGLPSTPLIHNVDLLRAFSYLIWLTQCGSVLLSSSKERMHSLSPGCRDALGLQTKRERDRGRDKGQTSLCERSIRSPLLRHLALVWLLPYIFVSNRHEGLRLSVTLVSYSDVWLWVFVPQSQSEWQDVLIVCFCLVCILSVFSISVFLTPLWSRAHFCFVSLNIALIVALTEVKPLLISFVYIVGDREREWGRESTLERRRGYNSDCSVWQHPSPVGVGRRERRLVFCLWQSGKSCHGKSLGLPSGFLRLFCSQPAFEILSVTERNTPQP